MSLKCSIAGCSGLVIGSVPVAYARVFYCAAHRDEALTLPACITYPTCAIAQCPDIVAPGSYWCPRHQYLWQRWSIEPLPDSYWHPATLWDTGMPEAQEEPEMQHTGVKIDDVPPPYGKLLQVLWKGVWHEAVWLDGSDSKDSDWWATPDGGQLCPESRYEPEKESGPTRWRMPRGAPPVPPIGYVNEEGVTKLHPNIVKALGLEEGGKLVWQPADGVIRLMRPEACQGGSDAASPE